MKMFHFIYNKLFVRSLKDSFFYNILWWEMLIFPFSVLEKKKKIKTMEFLSKQTKKRKPAHKTKQNILTIIKWFFHTFHHFFFIIFH